MTRLGQLPDHVLGLYRLLQQEAMRPIELHETHVSWVLVADELAYKLKKRIKLPFLDFRTLEARRLDCQSEVELNDRWAPDLYMGVVAIYGSDAVPVLEASGPAIDYAVLMKRLPSQSILRDRIRGTTLTGGDMEPLAHTIACMHLAAPVMKADKPVEGSWNLDASVQGVLGQLLKRASGSHHHVLMQLKDWVDAQLTVSRQCIHERVKKGFVRDCHGDLHMGNVAWWKSRWVLFDGVEFDPGLRTVDVIGDLAFLTMDLKLNGRSDLAFALLNAYLQHTGDYEGLKLLRLYEVQRALVRMFVTSMGGKASVQHLAFIQSLTDTALSKRPQLVLMHGLSGSGKSVLSSEIAVHLPAVRARSDVERQRLFEATEAGPARYTEAANHQVLDRLVDCAKAALEGGWSFIADATFLNQRDRDRFWSLGRRRSCNTTIVHCEAELSTLRRRVKDRCLLGHDASEATEAVLMEQVSKAEPLRPRELACAMTVCTEHAVSANALASICMGISGK